MSAGDIAAQPLRVAFFNTELSRDGPGLLLRDIQRGDDPHVNAVLEIITDANPDILVLQGIDWDLNGVALDALGDALDDAGLTLGHQFADRPNRGVLSGLDLNANGRVGDPQDAIGYGVFTGQGGMAVLSRHPIATGDVQDYTDLLWSELPGALLPYPGQPNALAATLPLSSMVHWLVPIDTPDHGRIWIGTFGATTPVFDGPEDRNGRRNHDEVRFWSLLLEGELQAPAPHGLVIAGNANLDPDRGDGRRSAIATLLAHSALQDPLPGIPTVDWGSDSAGLMRVSYVLPSVVWRVINAGVSPVSNTDASGAELRHRMVWVDLERR